MVDQPLKVQKPFKRDDLNLTDLTNSASEGQNWIDFLHGDDHALASLYQQYANKLFNYGCQFTSNKELVLDTVQDIFLNLIRQRAKLSIVTSVKFYLYASFRRSILRQLKRDTKFIRPVDMTDEGFQVAVSATYLPVNANFTADQKRIVEHYCNKLPIRQREALMLHYFEDLNYAEIAKTMKLSTAKSARTMVYRALDSLSNLLSSWKKELAVIAGILFILS